MRTGFQKGSLLLILFLLFQCSDDSSMSAFNGITETNTVNQLVGDIDDTDWQLNEKWNAREIALFSDLGISDLNNSNLDVAEFENVIIEIFDCTPGGRTKAVCGDLSAAYAYPNPAAHFINLEFKLSENDIKNFKLVVVNQAFDVLDSFDEFASGYDIDFASSGLKSRNTYRVYYLIQTVYSDFVLKGHGDIQVN